MATRRSQPQPVAATFAPERAHPAISKQLDSLQKLQGQNYSTAEHQEREWKQLTERIIELSFGKPSTNLSNFYRAYSAGDYYMNPFGETSPAEYQQNYNARMNACESYLKAILSELELMLPENEIKGHYEIGDEYDFYRDVKSILNLATSDVLIVDPYLSTEIFDTYADGLVQTAKLRILTTNPSTNVISVAKKYASSSAIELRTSTQLHDRLILIGSRVWFIGQSIKDAARKKPTYIVEQDGAIVGKAYENIWDTSTTII